MHYCSYLLTQFLLKRKIKKWRSLKCNTTETGLSYVDAEVGEGTEADNGNKVSVHYTGWLDQAGNKGKKFDSSVDRGQPFSFVLGQGMVIAGWDQGVKG